MFVFTLVVIGLLCIAFKSTRLTGIAGLTLLSLVHPLLFVLFLVVGAVFYFVYYKRSHKHELPKLFNRRS